MKIDSLVLGGYQTNCYVLRNSDKAKDCLIIDSGLDADEMIDLLHEKKLNPLSVILTHGHADHITGVVLLRENFSNIKVYIHKLDAKALTDSSHNLSVLAGAHFTTKPADKFLDDGDIIEQAGIKLLVLHTPGHTPGGICLYAKDENLVFVGDTLFSESIGRTDFPGGSMAKLIHGIKTKLFTLPENTIVYPGHGPATSIAAEKQYNPYLHDE